MALIERNSAVIARFRPRKNKQTSCAGSSVSSKHRVIYRSINFARFHARTCDFIAARDWVIMRLRSAQTSPFNAANVKYTNTIRIPVLAKKPDSLSREIYRCVLWSLKGYLIGSTSLSSFNGNVDLLKWEARLIILLFSLHSSAGSNMCN